MVQMSAFGYASPEQIIKDRADFARKGIAKGRSVVVGSCSDGILLVADNPSKSLHKLSELLDGIAFAAVGRYNEFESLRVGGIRYADTLAYTYSRADVTARALANEYARSLGSFVNEMAKPLEVELLLAQLAATPGEDQLFRIDFDGSLTEAAGFAVIGGQTDQISQSLSDWKTTQDWRANFNLARAALGSPVELEVALLARGVTGRAFRRLAAHELDS